MRNLGLTPFALTCGLFFACSSPELSQTNFACETAADCSDGQACREDSGVRACVNLDSTPIEIGMSGPLQGPSEDLGKEMVRGIRAALKRVNDAGGVYGREVVLRALNDNYDPVDAVAAVRELLDVRTIVDDPDQPDVRGEDGVFALVGNIGTPTMLATAPVATKNGVVFFAPFTGSKAYLRDDTNSPYVYNYRAGYHDETASMIDYLDQRIPAVIKDRETDYERIVVFAQEDSYGDAGYDGVVQAYNALSPLPSAEAILRVGYERENVESVDPAVEQAFSHLRGLVDRANAAGDTEAPVESAVIMIDTYLPGDRFIRKLKQRINEVEGVAGRLDPVFMHVSFVGSDSLSEALTGTPATYTDSVTDEMKSYAHNVMVTQVVPYYGSQAAGVTAYRDDIAAYDSGGHSFTSLEGYIVGRLFIEALRLNGPDLTTESFLQTLNTQIDALDLGIGTELSFSSVDHQASDTVWGTLIEEDGSFSVPYRWGAEGGLDPN